MNPQDLDRAIQRLLDGKLPPEEHAALQQVLETDPEALNTYLDCIDLHLILAARASSLRESSLIPKLVESTIDQQRRKALKISAMATAAAFVIVAVILRFTIVPNPPPVVSFQVSSDTHFEISHLAGSEEETQPGTLGIGSRLYISQGCVEFTFASGVRSIIQGPADLTLHDESRLYLAEGHAWFHVPKNAVGFQVATRELLVTDLGTEFAIVSAEDASDEVHVFSGRVHAVNQNGLKQEETLSYGQARLAGPAGRMKTIPLRANGFLTSLPDRLPHLHWSFDGEDPLQVSGTLPGASLISTRSVQSMGDPISRRLQPGKHGKALRFDGEGDEILTDWQGFLGRTPRTFACWIKLDSRASDANGVIADWGALSEKSNFVWRVRVAANSPDSPSTLRLAFGSNWVDGESEINDGRWHHIAVVDEGSIDRFGFPVLHFYVDGEEEELTYFPGTISKHPVESSPGLPLAFGRSASKGDVLIGTMDELYLFEGALSASSIHRLMNSD